MIARELTRRARQAGGHAASMARGSEPGPTERSDEAGAVLILALAFLLVAGGIIGSLLTWSSNDLLNTSNFQSARSLTY
jgi:hypothetical protein